MRGFLFKARFETLPVEGMQSAWWLWAENGLWNYDKGTPDVGCPGLALEIDPFFLSRSVRPEIRRALTKTIIASERTTKNITPMD